MSDLKASVSQTDTGFVVKGYEELNYRFEIIDGVFSPASTALASIYTGWGRVLVVLDTTVHGLYAEQIHAYFAAHGIPATFHVMNGGELNKNVETMLGIVDTFETFGLVRKEPVLVVGGGLVTDVAGYACASYRRSSNFIRVPTTLIGLIDASVSIKVAINHRKSKNRLGAYHAPLCTFLDFSFLRTLPEAQVRNGFAELMKIAAVGEKRIWELLAEWGVRLVQSRFGRKDGCENEVELRAVADEICWKGIKVMLELESPNLHELALDRVIAFGHTWSPTLELSPAPPLRHGHAITIDMAFSCTLAYLRGTMSEQERDTFYELARGVGLSVDHPMFEGGLLKKATEAILKTRDNAQRFAVPSPIGTCAFLNDVPFEELLSALAAHKQLVKERCPTADGAGKDAYVDGGDVGEGVGLSEGGGGWVDGRGGGSGMVNGVHGVEKGVKVNGDGKMPSTITAAA